MMFWWHKYTFYDISNILFSQFCDNLLKCYDFLWHILHLPAVTIFTFSIPPLVLPGLKKRAEGWAGRVVWSVEIKESREEQIHLLRLPVWPAGISWSKQGGREQLFRHHRHNSNRSIHCTCRAYSSQFW